MGAPIDLAGSPGPAPQRARRAMVVVDMVESVRLMAAHEDDVIERWRSFVTTVRTQLLPTWAGRLVKSLGDGLLLEFPDEKRALQASLALIEAIEPLNRDRPVQQRLDLRIGLHAADVVLDDLDVYGSGVNLAARLAGLAGPGQVVISQSAHQTLMKADALPATLTVEDLGWCYVKHLDEPAHAFRLEPARPTLPRMQVRPGMRSVQQEAEPAWEQPVPTVAVLTFTSSGKSDVDPVIAELLTEALQARLAACPGLRVISRRSSRALDEFSDSARQAHTQLNAQYVVRGRIHHVMDRLVAHAELLEAQHNRVAWAGHQAFQLSDLLEPDDHLSMNLATQLAGQIAEQQVRRAMTATLPTLDGNSLQFSASALMHQADREAFSRALALLEHLIDRYPRRPSPRAWAAMWYVLSVTRGVEHEPRRVADRALDHVHRALDHDPECSLALAMGGFVHCHLIQDLTAAEACLTQAVRLNPSEPWAWLFKSVVAAHRGQAENAWDWATRAAALSPLDPQRHYFDALRTSAAVAAGRYADAAVLARRALSVNPDHLPTLRGLAIAQVALGELEAARQTGRGILRVDPTFTLSGYLAAAPADGRETRSRYVEALLQAGLPLS
jgi:adenylate cyclase